MKFLRYTAYLLFFFGIIALFSMVIQAQPTPADAERLRKLEARAISAEQKVEVLTRQRDEWKTSAGNWESLYRDEKKRADELLDRGVVATQAKQITNLREQHAADKARIDSLERRVRSLKTQRNWALLGNGASFGAGYFLGKQSGGDAPPVIVQSRPSFGFTYKF